MVIMRGTVYEYVSVLPGRRPRQSTKRLIVTVDELNDSDVGLTAAGLLVDDEDPGGLLTVRIGSDGWFVSPSRIERILYSLVGGELYAATQEEMEQVAGALRAAYDL